MELNEKGQCCGRKPIAYRGSNNTQAGPHRFCVRCDRAYDLRDNVQIENWAWRKLENGNWQCKFERH